MVQSFFSGEARVALEEYQERKVRLHGGPSPKYLLNTLGAANLGCWSLFVSRLVLKLCRKETAVALTMVITVPFFWYTVVLVGTFGSPSPSR